MHPHHPSRNGEFTAPQTDLQPQVFAAVEGGLPRPSREADLVQLSDAYPASELASEMQAGSGVIAGEQMEPALYTAWTQFLRETQPAFFLRLPVQTPENLEHQLLRSLSTQDALAPLRGETIEATAQFLASELERFRQTRSTFSELSLYASTHSRVSGTILDTASAHIDRFIEGFPYPPYTLVRVLAGPGTLYMPDRFVHREAPLRAYLEERERFSQRVDFLIDDDTELQDSIRSSFDQWQSRLPFAAPGAYFEDLPPDRSHYIRGAVGDSLEGVIHKAPLEPRIVLVAR